MLLCFFLNNESNKSLLFSILFSVSYLLNVLSQVTSMNSQHIQLDTHLMFKNKTLQLWQCHHHGKSISIHLLLIQLFANVYFDDFRKLLFQLQNNPAMMEANSERKPDHIHIFFIQITVQVVFLYFFFSYILLFLFCCFVQTNSEKVNTNCKVFQFLYHQIHSSIWNSTL